MRILIAEDDLVSRKLLQGTLTRWGFEPVVCVDGNEALAELQRSDSPVLAILDWMMPFIDGIEVCRRLRQAPTSQPKYIILLTAKAQRDDIIRGLEAGADDYVTKPFDPKELKARLSVGIRIIGLQADLAEKVGALEVALGRLSQVQQSQKLEAIGRLASGVAHEINTPMQYIGDNIRFIESSWGALSPALQVLVDLPNRLRACEDPMDLAALVESLIDQADLTFSQREIPSAVSQSLEGVKRVTRIIRAMRDFSHPCDNHKCDVDLNRAIEATITVARNEWKYVADVETHFDAELPLVFCLPAEIQQVILNLIVNAADAIKDVVGKSEERGLIAISTARNDDAVEIRLSDTGRGIPKDIQDKVFEPFFTTKDIGQGTGQGLAIARSIVVQQHGGKIWFETEPGKGTTFVIHLPLQEKKEASGEPIFETANTACR